MAYAIKKQSFGKTLFQGLKLYFFYGVFFMVQEKLFVCLETQTKSLGFEFIRGL